MRKLALSDEILMSIEKPARYIGGEYNSVMKDKEQVDVRFCMCFPDVYEIGMSHLGIQILYDMFNRREDVYCERVYSPWPDLHQIMKEQLPKAGIHCIIVPRKQAGGKAISASTVRQCLQNGDWESLKALVPATTLEYFRSPEAAPVLARIQKAGNVVHY
mgnify:FL=1